MILEIGPQTLETIQKDSAVKIRFAIVCALYKALGTCDWEIKLKWKRTKHQDMVFDEIHVKAHRTKSYELQTKKRHIEKIAFEINGEELTILDVFNEAVGEVRKWARS